MRVFDNGSPIDATIGKGVTVSGAGLNLIESRLPGAPPHDITVNNEGAVTTIDPLAAIKLTGSGGDVTYSGNGAITSANPIGVGLSVADQGGPVSITTGAGAISGGTGILASDAYNGALTITTGAGLVSGSAGPGVQAMTAKGPLNVTIGSGGVTHSNGDHAAVNLVSNNGDISLMVNGEVSASGVPKHGVNNIDAIHVVSNGRGNIVVGGSGTVYGPDGHGIAAYQSNTGLGGVEVTGRGETIGTGPLCPQAGPAATRHSLQLGMFGCSAVRAEIENKADANNVVVNRSGFMLGTGAAVYALTAGGGNIVVSTGLKAQVIGIFEFGVEAQTSGSGKLSVSIGANGAVGTGGTGVLATNVDNAIAAAAGSDIDVTTRGTITSSATQVGGEINRKNPDQVLAGISAGYVGGGTLRRAIPTPNPNVNGAVDVVNDATINIGGGDGIFAFNFGNGAVSVSSTAAITVTGATAQNGIEAISAETGNISVSTAANIAASGGDGIRTDSAGVGTTTITVFAGVVEGAGAGVAAASAKGPIEIANSGTIQNVSPLPGALAVATSGAGAALLVNTAGGVITGAVAMTGSGTNSFVNAGAWNTEGVSAFAGASAIVNSGMLNVLGATTFDGLTRLTDSGVLDLAAGNEIDTLHVAGDAAFLPGSTYVVDLDAGRGDVLIAMGKVTLSGGTVVAQAAPGTMTLESRYTILTADRGVSGHFASLAFDPDFAFIAPVLTYDADSVVLSFTRTASSPSPAAPFASAAATPNEAATAAAAQGLGPASPLFEALSGQSVAGARAAFDALSGEIHPSAVSAAFDDSRLPREAVLDRLATPLGEGAGASGFDATNAIVGPGLPSDVFSAWGQAFGSSGHIGGNGNSATLDDSLAGFILGIEGTWDNRYRIGVAGGYTQSSLSVEARDSSGSVGSTFSGVYGGASFSALQLRGGALYTYNRYGADRSVGFPGFSDSDSAGYGGDTLQAFGEAGWRMGLSGLAGPSFVEPFVGALAMHIDTSSFAESGGVAALNGASQGYDFAATTLGVRGEATLFANVPLLARGMLGWRHVFGDTTPASTLAFEGAPSLPFSIAGAPIARDSLLIEAGLDWRLSSNATIGLFYSGALGARDQDNAVKGRLEIAF